jgi:hypothetical protein
MKLPVTRSGATVVLDLPVKTETVARPHDLKVAHDVLWQGFSTRP